MSTLKHWDVSEKVIRKALKKGGYARQKSASKPPSQIRLESEQNNGQKLIWTGLMKIGRTSFGQMRLRKPMVTSRHYL